MITSLIGRKLEGNATIVGVYIDRGEVMLVVETESRRLAVYHASDVYLEPKSTTEDRLGYNVDFVKESETNA